MEEMSLFEEQCPGPNHPPFPYPGGKTMWRSYLTPVLQEMILPTGRLISPFLGGGSVEVNLACHYYPVVAGDTDADLVECWQQVLEDSQAVGEAALSFWPESLDDLTKEAFYDAAGQHRVEADPVRRAALFLYGQCFCYGAKGFRAGTRDEHKSTKRSVIDRLLEGYYLPDFEVEVRDWGETLELADTNDAVFLDPPYPGREMSLYYTKDFDWNSFYDRLDALHMPWVMTIAKDDLADRRLGCYKQFTFDYVSTYNGKKYAETIVTSG